MLESLRKAAGTWVAKALLLLLLVSFAVWGISGRMFTGNIGNAVLTAGSAEVTLNEYRLAYNRQLAQFSQQVGQRITREQAQLFGIDNLVLAQLSAGAVLDAESKALKLGLSKDRLATLIAEDPTFQDTNGAFSRSVFRRVLSDVGMTEEDYIRSRGQVAVRQQIVEAVSDGISPPAAYLEAAARHAGESRTVDFVALNASVLGEIADPDEATLKTWYDANKKSFDAPEYRSISFVQLTAKAIADPAAISDASISEDYEKNKERYRTPEQRHIEQLVFPDREAAQAALDLIRAGGGFEEAVTDAGKTMSDVDLGMMARGAVANPAIGDAAFALQQGAVSDIVDGPFGPVLLRVTEIRPEAIKPFEEVKDEIRNDLALVEANDLLLETHDSYEDARAGGESMKEAAARLKLPFATVESVDRRGLRPDESIVSDLPESATLLANAFEADAGVENVPMNIREGGFLWYEVDAITPSRERPLDEVRQKAVDTWRKQETDRLLREKAEALLKELRDGKPLADLAASVNLAVETKYGLQRNGEDPDFGPGGAMAVFSGGPSHKGLAQSADGERQLLFQVTESAEPAGLGPDSIPESQRRQIGAAVADDLLDQLVTRLQQEYPVLINQAAIERALQF